MVQGIQSGDDPVCLAVRLLACLPTKTEGKAVLYGAA